MASVTNGAEYVWTSPFIPKIVNDKVNYNISEAEASYFAMIHPLSTIIFSLVLPPLNDVLGRKYSVLLTGVPHTLFWILTTVATNVNVFYVSRIISGLGDAVHTLTVQVYLGEIATPSVRGKWGNSVPFVTFGEFLINLIGQYCSVRLTSYICLYLPVIFVILMYFVPESPYWSIIRSNEEEAKKSLRFLRGKQDVDKEFLKLKADVERQMSENGTWKDLFLIDSNRKAFGAAVFLRTSQQFTGLSPVLCYTELIFEKSGSNIGSGFSSVLTIGLLCVITFIAGPVIEKLGRKKAYLSSMFACSVLLLLEAVYFYLDQQTTVDIHFLNWFPLIGMILYIIVCSLGVSPIPVLMVGELFSSSIKSKAVAILTVVMGLAVFLSNGIFYYLLSTFGIFAPFFFFGICGAISTILTLDLVPETKGKTLEEIQQILKEKKLVDCKNWTVQSIL